MKTFDGGNTGSPNVYGKVRTLAVIVEATVLQGMSQLLCDLLSTESMGNNLIFLANLAYGCIVS